MLTGLRPCPAPVLVGMRCWKPMCAGYDAPLRAQHEQCKASLPEACASIWPPACLDPALSSCLIQPSPWSAFIIPNVRLGAHPAVVNKLQRAPHPDSRVPGARRVKGLCTCQVMLSMGRH